MPNQTDVWPLYRIEECQDLMADACVCDDRRNLVLLTLWGRDTAVQEFLARLSLKSSEERGLDHFHLLTEEHLSIPVYASDIDRLEKRTTRVFKRTLFGSMLHVCLIDRRCVKPDKANATALALIPKDVHDRQQRLWKLIQETCPLPLLDHWHDAVLDVLNTRSMLTKLSFALGRLEAYQLTLDVPTLTTELGALIRSGRLSVSPRREPAEEPLRQVA